MNTGFESLSTNLFGGVDFTVVWVVLSVAAVIIVLLGVFGLLMWLRSFNIKVLVFERRGTGVVKIHTIRAKRILDDKVAKLKFLNTNPYHKRPPAPFPRPEQFYTLRNKDLLIMHDNGADALHPVSFDASKITLVADQADVTFWAQQERKKDRTEIMPLTWAQKYGQLVGVGVLIAITGVFLLIIMKQGSELVASNAALANAISHGGQTVT